MTNQMQEIGLEDRESRKYEFMENEKPDERSYPITLSTLKQVVSGTEKIVHLLRTRTSKNGGSSTNLPTIQTSPQIVIESPLESSSEQESVSLEEKKSDFFMILKI